MELEITRTYFPHGTNGELTYKGKRVCSTIELPDHDNKPRVSCIPEGKYELVKRCSDHFGEHILLKGVKGRDLILIHPANDAFTELKGCIAPVTILTAEGHGLRSHVAFEKVKNLVYAAIDNKEKVFLIIKTV